MHAEKCNEGAKSSLYPVVAECVFQTWLQQPLPARVLSFSVTLTACRQEVESVSLPT